MNRNFFVSLQKCNFMIYLKHVILALLFLMSNVLFAQDANPTVSFRNPDTKEDVEMAPGEDQSAPAPLPLKLFGNLEDYKGWNANCEWTIEKVGQKETTQILDRFEENTTFTLTQSGTYHIKFMVTFTKQDEEDIVYESDVFTVSVSESKLSCPDGFSPNGDNINDVFKITYQSIISMKGSIFNRWGQRVYSFDLSNVDNGWDGKQGGKYVKDGVYYLNLEAVGSDGIKYDIKKAINVLKGFREYDK